MLAAATRDQSFLPWINTAGQRNIAIVGICKNAGKTTLLNAILQNFPKLKWGVLSTGRDGESTDTVFKTPKPRVLLNPGTLFCADAKSMEEHGSAIKLLAKTPWQRGGNKLYVAQAINALATEISGPGTASAQSACAELMHHIGAEKVLIDGSLDRKSVAMSDGVDALVMVAGASFGSIAEIIAELSRLKLLAGIPSSPKLDGKTRNRLLDSQTLMLKQKGKWLDSGIHSLIGHEKELLALLAEHSDVSQLYIPGAYSLAQHHRLSEQLLGKILLFRHPECIKLKLRDLEEFTEQHQLKCVLPFCIKATLINSVGVGSDSHDAQLFRMKLRQAFPQENLMDLMEL